jgi:predicted RNA binding protein YcfA (HicA-like mRNA interferase family)
MTQKQKLLRKLLTGSNNIAFNDMVAIVEAFGFQLSRVNGSHHIFENAAISEQLNLQNKKGKAKPYQIKQFLQLVEQYNLTLESTGENE